MQLLAIYFAEGLREVQQKVHAETICYILLRTHILHMYQIDRVCVTVAIKLRPDGGAYLLGAVEERIHHFEEVVSQSIRGKEDVSKNALVSRNPKRARRGNMQTCHLQSVLCLREGTVSVFHSIYKFAPAQSTEEVARYHM